MAEKRPYKNAPELLDEVTAELLPEVLDWLKEDFTVEDAERLIVQTQLRQAFLDWRGGSFDGYSLAQRLETAYNWHPNAKLVEILDRAALIHADRYDQAVRKWREANPNPPLFKIDDHVYVTIERQQRRGRIVEINSLLGQYYVTIPEMGQVYDTEARNLNYYVVNFEVLEAEQHLTQDVGGEPKEEGISF